MVTHHSILLIEDSPGEQELFRLALKQTGLDILLFTEQDAEAALRLLNTQTDLPALILLDWHLGTERGDVFLKKLRADPRLAAVPVVVFTTSDDASDRTAAYASGANGYVVKPGTFDELGRCVETICQFWTHVNLTPYLVETQC